MDEEEVSLGEDIWRVFTWRKELAFKTNLIQKYITDLGFPDCVKQILNLIEIYCEKSLIRYNENKDEEDEEEDDDEEEEIKPSIFENGDVLSVLIDEILFALLEDPSFKAIQELRLLDILCTYFGAESLNSLKYLVFDCLFGNVCGGESDEVFKELKLRLLKKLISMAIGVQCLPLLEAASIWIQKNGVRRSETMEFVSSLINDYFLLIPAALPSFVKVADISPSLACQLVRVITEMYDFEQGSTHDARESRPSAELINTVGRWMLNKPEFCMLISPHPLTLLPSIYDPESKPKKMKKSLSPIIGLFKWTIVAPIFSAVLYSPSEQTLTSPKKSTFTKEDIDQTVIAYSKLHHGILTFLSTQRKIDTSMTESEDEDLEPGELIDEGETQELITTSDLKGVVETLKGALDKFKGKLTDENIEISIDRLAQIIQIGRWSGCLTCPHDKLKSILKKLSRTRLLSVVMKT